MAHRHVRATLAEAEANHNLTVYDIGQEFIKEIEHFRTEEVATLIEAAEQSGMSDAGEVAAYFEHSYQKWQGIIEAIASSDTDWSEVQIEKFATAIFDEIYSKILTDR